MKALNCFKALSAVFVIAAGVSAQGSVWDGTVDLSWYKSTQNEFTITTARQLAGLAQLVNGGNNMQGRTITLGADIMLNDTTGWKNWSTTSPANTWTAIGTNSKGFCGAFDGAGYVVSGVYINNSESNQGLFGYLGMTATSATIDVTGMYGAINNLGVIASYVRGNNDVGLLAGNKGGTITNCYSEGNVKGNKYVGGLVGYIGILSSGTITNCYSEVNVSGNDDVGGLVGTSLVLITNSYATGDVSGTGDYVGGLVGYIGITSGMMTNSYATGNVEGKDKVGGLAGGGIGTISGCYATGDIKGSNSVGGLVGGGMAVTISGCYATGNVEGSNSVGGLAGEGGNIESCYAAGDVAGKDSVGGLVGISSYKTISNSYATGNVEGKDKVGGLVGMNYGLGYGMIKNSYAGGDVKGNNYIGGLVGMNDDGKIENSYALGDFTGETFVDELVGESLGNSTFTNIHYKPNTALLGVIHSEWDFRDIWGIDAAINAGYPYLLFKTDITGKITDNNFRQAIYEVIGKKSPELIYDADVATITVLELPNKGILSLSGIEYFTSLIILNVGNGQQKRDDVSTPNRITVLDLLNNTQLQEVDVSGNELTELNVYSLTDLMRLNVSGNNLTGLNVSNNTELEELNVDGNRIGSISDIIGLLNTKINEEEFVLRNQRPTSITNRQAVRRYGILLEKAVVSEPVEMKIIAVDKNPHVSVVIYDNLGNVVFDANGRTDSFVWDLTNKTGRNVANGSYLVIAEAKGVSGKVYRYSAKIGVKR